jgi:hypothetical protein
MKYPDYRDVLRERRVKPFVIERTVKQPGHFVLTGSIGKAVEYRPENIPA